MRRFKFKIILLIICGGGLLTLENCCYDGCCFDEDCSSYKKWGYKPVYSNDLDDIVVLEEPRPLQDVGKIYSYQNLLLVNERQKGLHVIDNSDPTQPNKLHFLKIAGSNDVAIKNGYLYADQFDNLIVVSIDELANIIDKKMMEDAFENYADYNLTPDEYDVYYECPDPGRGVVVSWVQDSVKNPCYHSEY